MLFRDRSDAGKKLSAVLQEYADRPDVVVVALPRGGVPVGYEVAQALHAPLDILVVRKLGFPGQEEWAMGAIASGVLILNPDARCDSNLSSQQIQAALNREIASETQELERRERLYRGDWKSADIVGKTVIAVDDGLATGSSMRAAIAALRQKHAKTIVAAVPVAAPETWSQIEADADRAVCLSTPSNFCAVSQWYQNPSQTSDAEVQDLLARSHRTQSHLT